MATDEITFKTKIDLEIEKASILAFYNDLILADREIPPKLTLYRDAKPMVSITCRSTADEQDQFRAIVDMLYLYPSANATTAVLSFAGSVKLVDRIQDSIIITAFHQSGALTEVYPYDVPEDRSAVNYDREAQIDSSVPVFSKVIGHALQVFSHVVRSPLYPIDIITYLNSIGYDIAFMGDFNENNITALANM